MVSPLRAVVVLVQQLIEDYNLTDPAVIAQFVSTVVVQQFLIPACTILVMIVSSYQLLQSTYYWLYPPPPSTRYRQAIELYSGGGGGGGGNRRLNGNGRISSKIVSLHRNKKTTVSDTTSRLLKRLERRQKQDQLQAIREFEKLVLQDQYGPALLSLAVHRLYIESDPVGALKLLNLVSNRGGGGGGDRNDSISDDHTTKKKNKDGKNDDTDDATSRNSKKSRQSTSASALSLAVSSPSKSKNEFVVVQLKLTTTTLRRDYMTLKLDAEALIGEEGKRNSCTGSTCKSSRDMDKDSNNNSNNSNNNTKMTAMSRINSKMMKMDYLGIVSHS